MALDFAEVETKKLEDETTFPFYAEFNRHWKGPPVSRATLTRWWGRGICVPGRSERVKIEAKKFGGVVICSVEAVQRFLDAQNAPRVTSPRLTAGQRKRSGESAMTALAGMGVASR